jgi:osmotically inducible protein OsmC
MPVRKAEAVWNGGLRDGSGTVKLESGAYEGSYSFASRFEQGGGTNPEELIAAAHAGCFSMALSAALGKAGFQPQRISTSASVHLEKVGDAFAITRIDLVTSAAIPNIDEARFLEIAGEAKANCPVSKALRAVDNITLDAKLEAS